MEFPVKNSAFAAYLVAAKKLNLLRIDADRSGVVLIFDDPSGTGAQLELEYLSGAALVSALAYQNSLRAVRRSVEIKLAAIRQVRDGGSK